MKTLLKLAVILALCLPAVAQTSVARMPNAVTIATEGNYILSVSIPGVVFQWGAGSSGWCPTLVTALKTPIYLTNTPALCAFDPAPNVVKSLAVQQGTSAFNVTVVANGKATTLTISALPLPTTTTYAFSCPGTIAGTITTVSGVTSITAATVTLSPGCKGVQQ